MANPTFTLIASNTVGSGGVSSVTFSSIPATYTDLIIKASIRTDNASNLTGLITLNGSSSSFTYRQIEGNGTNAVSYNGTTNATNTGNGTGTTASTFSSFEFYFPNYAGSTNKSFSVDSVTENNATTAYADMSAILWSNTAAITSISLAPGSTANFAQYSTFYLYGIKNS
jgi:hypothetical protein